MEIKKSEPLYGPMEYIDGHWEKTFYESLILDERIGMSLGMARESIKEHLCEVLLDYIQPGTEYKIALAERTDETIEFGKKYTMGLKIILEESMRK